MGSTNNEHKSSKEKLVKVQTSEFKERLNRVYKMMHSGSARRLDAGRFDYLWDLKEMALMEGRQSIDVPATWLEEIEKGLGESDLSKGH